MTISKSGEPVHVFENAPVNERVRLGRIYVRKGWLPHPLSSPTDKRKSPGKRPLFDKWQKTKKGAIREHHVDKYFGSTDYNVGLILGKESDQLCIDYDKIEWLNVIFPQEQRILENTLRDQRIPGRGHIYFKHTDKLPKMNLHEFGIEVLSDGSQVVAPPSIHAEGQEYKWILPEGADIGTFVLPDVPEIVIKNLLLLRSFYDKITGCRPCFRWIVSQHRFSMHAAEGRRLMLATATEMKAEEVTLEEFRLYAKKVYEEDYDPKCTAEEWRNVDPKKRWQCETIIENFPMVRHACKDCKGLAKISEKQAPLPPIPYEEVEPGPCDIKELVEVFEKWLFFEEVTDITIPTAMALANFTEADPDIFGIIAPSGSYKTEFTRSLGDSQNQFIYPISSLTARTFVSGLEKNQDLVPLLRKRLVTIKDFTTILAKKDDEKGQIFADLRELGRVLESLNRNSEH
jgi:hypothetical protein